MSRQELADLVNAAVFGDTASPLDGPYIGKLERGIVRWPQANYRTALRTILNADTDAALGFYPRRTAPTAPGVDLVRHGTAPRACIVSHGSPLLQPGPAGHDLPTLGTDSEEVPADAGLAHLWTPAGLVTAFEEVAPVTVSPLQRRRFLALSGATLAAAAHEWLVADPPRLAASLNGKTADSRLVADLDEGVDLLRRLDDKLGGQAIHGMVTEQLRLVVRVLRHARYTQADGQSLYAIAAELARLAGWTSYDAGDHGTAQRYYLIGLRAAHEADAPGIGANILRCMAEQATTSADHRTAVDLLRSARAGARGRLTATESAVLAGHLAMAHGRADDPRAAYAAADYAQRYLADSRPDEDPPYLYWAGPHIVALSVGSALVAAGRARAAIPHLRSSVDGTPPDSPRDLMSHQMKLARACARAGDPDEAVDLVHRSIGSSPIPVSGWVAEHFAEACRDIQATGHPGSGELAEHARSVIRPSTDA
jgi:hypothetical protein